MLFATLAALLVVGVIVGIFVYAISSAADGREDESGFHFVGAPKQARVRVTGETLSRDSQSETAASAIQSRPAA